MVEIFSQMLIDVLIIVVSFLALNYSSNLTINNAVKVATATGLGKTSIGFSLIAFSTSLPELTVALIAAFSGSSALSAGNVLGSNIVNICVTVGLAALLVYYYTTRSKAPNPNVAKLSNGNIFASFAEPEMKSIYFGLFISSLIPVILIYISNATWIVGLILIGIFVGYMYQLSKVRIPPEEGDEAAIEQEKHKLKIIILTITGALGVVASAYFLVQSAVSIAQSAGLSQQVIGATIIALGTSLPEITIGLKSILGGHSGLAFGDIIGSSFVNITLILGVTLFVPALVGSPIILNTNVFQSLILFSIITNMLFWYFLSRKQMGKNEGVLFLFIYVLFIVITIGEI
jgi:cation:H+ antiporter